MQQTKESKDAKDSKIRVFALAKEMNLETKVLLEYCKELGYAGIKNQLNALEPDQVDALKDRAKKGPAKAAGAGPAPTVRPAVPAAPPKLDARIPTIKAKPAPVKPAAPAHPPTPVPAPTPAAEAPPPAAPPEPEPVPVPTAVAEAPPAPAPVAPPPAPAAELPPPVAEPAAPPAPVAEAPAVEPPAPAAPVPPPVAASASGRIPTFGPTRPMNLNAGGRPQNLGPARPGGLPPRQPSPAAPPPGGTAPPRPAPAAGPGGVPPRPAPPPPGATPRPANPGPRSADRRTGPARSASRPTAPGRAAPGGPARPGGLPPRQPAAGPGGPGGPPRPGSPYPPPRPPGPGGPAGGPPRPGMPGMKPPAVGAPRTVKLSPEQIQRLRELERQRGGQKVAIQDFTRHNIVAPGGPTDPAKPGGPPRPGARPGAPRPPAPRTSRRARATARAARPARAAPASPAGRADRARQDKGRSRGPTTDRGAVVIGAGGRVDIIDTAFGSRIKKHRGKQHVAKKPASVVGGKVEITLPITVRSLSEAIGMKVGELLLKLKQLTNSLFTINTAVEFEVAELIATEKGIELAAKKQVTAETELDAVLKKRAESAAGDHRVARPPIVTIMGHVDHGKTSLLDKIRQEYGLSSDVVSTEAGGITQVIRAWRVQKGDKSTTFLDTPGHEAFTKMRARGANVTDIAVIVVSAADGIMPQTQEAVAHAKAADVDIIVAINKVDLPGANPEKVKNQLYSMELVPEDMGGDVPVVYTSAVTGQGVGDLLDAIGLLAELADLKADPDVSASGTCLEAYLDPEEGVQATLLVQEGTLHRGDVMLCGATFGKVRAMYDDLGRPIESAGPSTPVRITGLDDVPDADDPFYAVPEVGTAREIAGKRRDRKQEAALHKFTPVSLDKLKEQNAKAKITELKVILKAEARGSVEAIRKELEKLTHEEVRTRVLHAGIGAITESDVTLALTNPDDTIIVGFNVTADDAALRLAEQRDIKIREYDIIYKLTDDIKSALEGKLKPVEEVVHLGRAVIRQTFKVGKVGTIAGCHVTSGVIERSAGVRVIREGVVIYPPSEKVVGLDSLKRFKDDAKDVREGYECGMKITGFDDVKTGDVIEAFKIETRQRTL